MKNLDELLNDLFIAEEAVFSKIMSEAKRLNVFIGKDAIRHDSAYRFQKINAIKNAQDIEEYRKERE